MVGSSRIVPCDYRHLMRFLIAAPLVVVSSLATAPAFATEPPIEPGLDPEIQLDLGLSVVGVGYEHPIAQRLALQLEGGIFGTYFLPWFDLGGNVRGGFGGLRGTFLTHADGHGLYVTPYVRAGYGSGERDGMTGKATLVEVGAFVGWAFRLGEHFDLRVGGGAQYLYLSNADGVGASTPFVAIDILVGYRI